MQKQIGTYSHILKPFNAYSARYINGNTDITVNYSLDNYVTIYGKVNGKYDTRSGYLITNEVEISRETEYQINVKEDITSSTSNVISLENLNETISYSNYGNRGPKKYPYVYDSNNTKVYFDGNTPFQITKSKDEYERTNLEDASIHYKKISFLTENKNNYYNVYQALNSSNDEKIKQGHFYKTDNDESNKLEENKVDIGFAIDLKKDCSAINYYVESYCFSKWAKENLSNIDCSDIDAKDKSLYGTGRIFAINNSDNNPEDKLSTFYEHKREVIKQSLITNLNQAITSYSRNSKDVGEYKLPVLSEPDWDRLVDNVSIISFIQGIPIGLKTYNNYAIATSTRNKEFVNSESIYLQKAGDKSHHVLGCAKLGGDDNVITGYRNIDYDIQRVNNNKDHTQYYFSQNSNRENCYYCLVQRALLEAEDNPNAILAHTKALAREKANQAITQVELEKNYDNIEPIYPTEPDPDPDPEPEPEPDGNKLIELYKEGIVKLGDIINYNPIDSATGDLEYLSPKNRNGHSDQFFYARDDVVWRLLNVDTNTGTIELISDNVIKTDDDNMFWLQGKDGLVYAEEELHNISAIYGRGYGATEIETIYNSGYDNEEKYLIGTGARSIKVEDIDRIAGVREENGTMVDNYGSILNEDYGNEFTQTGTNNKYIATFYSYNQSIVENDELRDILFNRERYVLASRCTYNVELTLFGKTTYNPAGFMRAVFREDEFLGGNWELGQGDVGVAGFGLAMNGEGIKEDMGVLMPYGVRVIVTLKPDIEVEQNGYSWDLK